MTRATHARFLPHPQSVRPTARHKRRPVSGVGNSACCTSFQIVWSLEMSRHDLITSHGGEAIHATKVPTTAKDSSSLKRKCMRWRTFNWLMDRANASALMRHFCGDWRRFGYGTVGRTAIGHRLAAQLPLSTYFVEKPDVEMMFCTRHLSMLGCFFGKLRFLTEFRLSICAQAGANSSFVVIGASHFAIRRRFCAVAARRNSS
jgi:hypothetical protein